MKMGHESSQDASELFSGVRMMSEHTSLFAF